MSTDPRDLHSDSVLRRYYAGLGGGSGANQDRRELLPPRAADFVFERAAVGRAAGGTRIAHGVRPQDGRSPGVPLIRARR